MLKFEIVYYNGGEIYKQSKETNTQGKHSHGTAFYEDGISPTKEYFDFYKRVNHPSNIWPFLSMDENGKVKVYYMTKPFVDACYDNYGKWDESPNADISHIKLPKEIEVITSVAVDYGVQHGEKEIYFLCDTRKDMESISKFYKLPIPISSDEDFDNDDNKWKGNKLPGIFDYNFNDHTRRIDKTGVRMSSIKFDAKGNATMFKTYRRVYT